MADSIWGTGHRVNESLYRKGYEFEFFQAVRLLLLETAGGKRARALSDVVRFGVYPSMSFPPSPVVSVEAGAGEDGPAQMRVAFLGLIGPSRVLPDSYTELALRQRMLGDASFAEFFDLFHNRLLGLYYTAWEKHQFAVGQEQARGGRDRVSAYLLDLIGMGTAGLEDKLPFPDQALLRYAGLLAQRPRSAECLRAVLCDYLGLPVCVQQFRGRWHELDPEELTVLGSGALSSQLGQGAAAGDMVWCLSAIRVVLGPLSEDEFFAFAPDGSRFNEVTSMTRWYLGPAIEFEIQPVIAEGVTPGWGALGGADAGERGHRLRLGWSSWLTAEEFPEPAGEAIFVENERLGMEV